MIRLLLPFVCLFFYVDAQWSVQKSWQPENEEPLDRRPLRLDVRRYELRLQPFFPFPGFVFHPSKMMTFEGRLNITFGLFEPTELLQVNTAGLQIKQADVWAGERRLSTRVFVERLLPLATIRTDEMLEANTTFVLRLHFSGRIDQREARGLFAHNYVDERGAKRTMIATLLEPNYARRLFPCFDSIGLKAAFQLTIVHPRNASVFHNTLPESEEDFGDQLKITTFKPTLPMATYQFALAIGDFSIAETSSRLGVKVRSISLPHLGDHLRKAAKIAAKSIDFYESLLGVKFPLEKLDALFRSGYPVVSVHFLPHMLAFRQAASDGSEKKWNVPLFIQEVNTTDERLVWLNKDGSLCTKGGKWRPEPAGSFVFNQHGRTFARFAFDDEVRGRLLTAIPSVDPASQYAIINDLLDEKRRSPSSVDYAKVFIERIVDETGDLPPLLAKLFSSVYRGASVKPVVEKLCSAIDWDPQSLSNGIKTHSALFSAAQFGACGVSKKADGMFAEFVLKCFKSADILECNKMHGDVRSAVYCNAAKQRNGATLANYAQWMNGAAKRVLFEYDELPNVRRAMRCR
ncbi:Aminopeptidase Q [Aphelenchoides fujianensis]|nr:Aminopeptidase Q [Aphelenchoides fujianensis]